MLPWSGLETRQAGVKSVRAIDSMFAAGCLSIGSGLFTGGLIASLGPVEGSVSTIVFGLVALVGVVLIGFGLFFHGRSLT